MCMNIIQNGPWSYNDEGCIGFLPQTVDILANEFRIKFSRFPRIAFFFTLCCYAIEFVRLSAAYSAYSYQHIFTLPRDVDIVFVANARTPADLRCS